MNGRRHALVVGAGCLAGAGIALAPAPVQAHAIGQTFQLPVPLTLYLVGAATAVAASFVVVALISRRPAERPGYPVVPVPDAVGRVASVTLQVLGMAWWYGAMAAALLIGGITPLPAALFWIGAWVGLPIAAVLLGNPWPSLSPFRTTFALAERAAALTGADRLDLGLRYPPKLGRWPAVILLGAALWAELVLPGSERASTVGFLMAGYTILTLAGMLVFGAAGWVRNAELFEVELGWLGRIGPVGRRVNHPAVCEGCDEACNPERCVDCPECGVVADPGELRTELRPWMAGLTEVRRATWSDAAFIVLLLAGVTYDGIQETALWTALAQALLPPLLEALGPSLPFTIVGIVGLAATFGLFLAAVALAVLLTRRLGATPHQGFAEASGVYASTLLPIAAGYLVAHYLTLVIQGIVWLPGLLANPLLTVAPDVSWIPVSFVWYLSVAAIVGGHIAAIVLAHRIALRDAGSRPVLAGLPLVVLMIGYTVLSLWIIAQPIVIDPSVTPAAIAH
jgi:hypothetical protein